KCDSVRITAFTRAGSTSYSLASSAISTSYAAFSSAEARPPSPLETTKRTARTVQFLTAVLPDCCDITSSPWLRLHLTAAEKSRPSLDFSTSSRAPPRQAAPPKGRRSSEWRARNSNQANFRREPAVEPTCLALLSLLDALGVRGELRVEAIDVDAMVSRTV